MTERHDPVPRIGRKLDISNYLVWSHEIEYALRLRKLWGLVVPLDDPEAELPVSLMGVRRRSGTRDGGLPRKDGGSGRGKMEGTAAEKAAAKQEDAEQEAMETMAAVTKQAERAEQARVIIMMNVKAHHATKLRRYTAARGLWAALLQEFKPCGPAREINRRRQLNSIRMEEDESPMRYFNRGWEVVGLLGEMGIDIDEMQLLSALLAGLQPKYGFTSALLQNNRTVTIREASEDLRAADDRMGLEKAKTKRRDKGCREAIALTAADKEDPLARLCKQGETSKSDRFKDYTCYKCQQEGHIKRHCKSKRQPRKQKEEDDEEGHAGIALMAINATMYTTTKRTEWMVDSGAGHHMCGSADDLTNVRKGRAVRIKIADGKYKRSCLRGTAVLTVAGPSAPTTVTLKDNLVVPGLAMSLCTVSTATKRGYETVFSDSVVRVQDKEGKVFFQGHNIGGVYTLLTLTNTLQGIETTTGITVVGDGTDDGRAAPAKVTGVDAAVWHQRYSHAGIDAIKRTLDAV